ncbi:MAG TPA: 50S ribosomal protein L32 [Thermoanaerobaculia bacterium]|nr:50S ribosomal protein L32 [Thermoanaerobaculia bacterium]
MGVPKRRVSRARQGDRRAHQTLVLPQLEDCPHCHQKKRAHRACPNCGFYAGRPVLELKAPKDESTPPA